VQRGCHSKMAPSVGRATPEGAAAIPPEESGESFPSEHRAPAATVCRGKSAPLLQPEPPRGRPCRRTTKKPPKHRLPDAVPTSWQHADRRQECHHLAANSCRSSHRTCSRQSSRRRHYGRRRSTPVVPDFTPQAGGRRTTAVSRLGRTAHP
jgi:hypothetical protein